MNSGIPLQSKETDISDMVILTEVQELFSFFEQNANAFLGITPALIKTNNKSSMSYQIKRNSKSKTRFLTRQC